jgi:hypothetical protein
MAKRTTEALIRAQKEAKQKKLLFLLVPLFLGLVVWQGPKMLHSLKGSQTLPTPTPAEDLATPGLTPTGTTPTGIDAGGGLPDTDLQPGLLEGQLISFSRFGGRDPFGHSTPASASPNASLDAATFEVNGTSEGVALNGAFPAKDPTFRLISVGGQSATIGLVSGRFSSGADTITINVGQTLVIVANDGARYTVKLISVAVPLG